jgi:hypothetical protein
MTMGTPAEPPYVHDLPPKDGVAVVYVAPVMDEACAAVSSAQTLAVDDAALLATLGSVLGTALTEAEGDGADVLAAAAAVFDPFEHAVADRVTSTRPAADSTMDNRMTSPRLRAQYGRWRQQRSSGGRNV